jgi:hypothetical protein
MLTGNKNRICSSIFQIFHVKSFVLLHDLAEHVWAKFTGNVFYNVVNRLFLQENVIENMAKDTKNIVLRNTLMH